jgi:hypothetical protein
MSLAARRYLNRTHLVEQLTENWQFDHVEAMGARDLEELVEECLELDKLSKRAWKALVTLLFDPAEKSDKVFAGEALVRSAISRTIKVFRFVQKLIEDAESGGYTIAGAADFRKSFKEVLMLQKEIAEKWPTIDSGMIEESMAAYRRGEFQLAEDVLNELEEGGCSKAD